MIQPRIIPNVPASTTTITAPSQRRDQTGASAALNRRRSETEIAAADFSSSTTGDHIEVLTEALASIPQNFRPRPGDPDSPSVLIRSDSAGATYGFAKFCREVGVGFSFGFAVREPVRDALGLLADAAWLACLDGIDVWYPTINADGTIRDGAWVAEATDLLDLSEWPAGSRVILRKERPHPGAQLTFRTSTVIGSPPSSPTPRPGWCPASWPDWTCGTASTPGSRTGSGRRRRPGCGTSRATTTRPTARGSEIVMTAMDLVAWSKLLGFADEPDLARCEIATFRYRVLHVAARISHSARQTRLRIDQTWRWAEQITRAWHQIRAAFT